MNLRMWITFATAVLLATPAIALSSPTNWITLNNIQSVSGNKTSVDISDVEIRDNEQVMLWMKTEYAEDQPIRDTPLSYRTALFHRIFDCRSREFAITALIWYEGEQGTSKVISTKTIPSEKWRFLPVVPDTASADWIEFACKFSKNKKSQKTAVDVVADKRKRAEPEPLSAKNSNVEEVKSKIVYYPVVPFTVNLADKQDRYLQIQFTVQLHDRKQLFCLEENNLVFRNEVIGILSKKSSSELKTAKGKEVLRSEIIDSVHRLCIQPSSLDSPDVLYTSFIIQ